MSIRFSCVNCGQRLSVGQHKAGQQATCPKCKTQLQIPPQTAPQNSPPVTSLPPTQLTGNAPQPMRTIAFQEPVEEHVEVVYAQAPSIMSGNRKSKTSANDLEADLERIALPRYVIFAQGLLLAVVAVACFLLGLGIGSVLSGRTSQTTVQSAKISGNVSLLKKGERMGDLGATLLFIPLEATPEEKISLHAFMPQANTVEQVAADSWLNKFGGKFFKCVERGKFEVALPSKGRFYVLVFSANAPKNDQAEPTQQQLGQMSRYFELDEQSFSKVRYQWRMEEVRGDTTLNIDFD
jgi:hypothetical protein